MLIRHIAILCLLFPLGAGLASAQETGPLQIASTMVEAVVKELTAQREALNSSHAIETGHPIVHRLIAPQVDFERLTRDATGPAWMAASPARRLALHTEFRTLLIHVIARLLTAYNEEKLEVVSSSAGAGADEAVVRINVTPMHSPSEEPPGPMFAYYHLTAAGWKIFDFSSDGILLSKLYAGNFSVVLEREGGIDGLINALQKRNARNATHRTAAG